MSLLKMDRLAILLDIVYSLRPLERFQGLRLHQLRLRLYEFEVAKASATKSRAAASWTSPTAPSSDKSAATMASTRLLCGGRDRAQAGR